MGSGGGMGNPNQGNMGGNMGGNMSSQNSMGPGQNMNMGSSMGLSSGSGLSMPLNAQSGMDSMGSRGLTGPGNQNYGSGTQTGNYGPGSNLPMPVRNENASVMSRGVGNVMPTSVSGLRTSDTIVIRNLPLDCNWQVSCKNLNFNFAAVLKMNAGSCRCLIYADLSCALLDEGHF